MARLDLDAARAARAAESEGKGEPHVVVLDGEEFTLPPEMPLDAALAIGEGRLEDFFAEMMNGQHEDFTKHKLSVDDLVELTDGIAEFYGLDTLGEALASRTSSRSTGKRSRPTSKRTTA